MMQNLNVSFHRGMYELPLVQASPGLKIQLLHVDIKSGLWVLRTCLALNVTLERHQHTGEVFAFTLAGAWKYLEYPEINTKGSYLYEPAGSVHTLYSLATNEDMTDICFVIRGANLNLNEAGGVNSIVDAASALEAYRELCHKAGYNAPDVIGT